MTHPEPDFFHYLNRPITRRSRVLVALFCVPLVLSFFFPLWRISMEAPQYPGGLWMDIWSYQLTGGNEGQHIDEINTLNHYIGMRRITREELADLDWIPVVLGGLVLLGLRTALLGNVRTLIDMTTISTYVSLFALGRFAYVLYQFGHELDPKAPMDVEPFQPAVMGSKQVANFMTHSYPRLGSVMVGLFVAGLWVVTLRQLWRGRQEARAARVAGAGLPE